MKQDGHITSPKPGSLLLEGMFRDLDPLARDLRKLDCALKHLQAAGGDINSDAVQRLRRDLRDFEPSVTIIGQVKAGKTTLVNVMSGGRNLLPSDVNPWTSVVTSLHLSSTLLPANEHARFRFFSEEEWTNLLNTGGRVGELAGRAGAEKEVEKVRLQLNEMREKSRRRLGASFEQLLGQTHEYRYLDQELIQRYVCLGDDFADDTNAEKTQGQFADITKSADLFIGAATLPLSMCLRDTPGVNDTFMVREQITLNAIRGSRLCVVVLSAHQALSTVDLALIRMIANIPSRDVIIFVNRVDELENPADEVPEIRASIQKTLSAQGISTETRVIFGSAAWAHHAVNGELNAMGRGSAQALINLAEYEVTHRPLNKDPLAMVWDLSGLPALGHAIAERTIAGEGAQATEAIASGARNIASAIAAERTMADRRTVEGPAKPIDVSTLTAALDAITATATTGLSSDLDTLLSRLNARLDLSRQAFVSRAVVALIEHLETYGEDVVWTYDPTGLRLLLKSGYQVFIAKVLSVSEERFLGTSHRLKDLFAESFSLTDAGYDLEPPVLPQPPAPIKLGQTIALDIKGGWWTRWWRRSRSYQAYADEFRTLIDAEIGPMVDGLKADMASPFKETLMSELEEFVATQRKVFLALADQSQTDLATLRQCQTDSYEAELSSLNDAHSILVDYCTAQRGRS